MTLNVSSYQVAQAVPTACIPEVGGSRGLDLRVASTPLLFGSFGVDQPRNRLPLIRPRPFSTTVKTESWAVPEIDDPCATA